MILRGSCPGAARGRPTSLNSGTRCHVSVRIGRLLTVRYAAVIAIAPIILVPRLRVLLPAVVILLGRSRALAILLPIVLLHRAVLTVRGLRLAVLSISGLRIIRLRLTRLISPVVALADGRPYEPCK